MRGTGISKKRLKIGEERIMRLMQFMPSMTDGGQNEREVMKTQQMVRLHLFLLL